MSFRAGLFAPTRDRGLILAWILGCCVLIAVIPALVTRPWMIDGRTFFHVWDTQPLYLLRPNTQGAYLYSPLFAQLLTPLTWLPYAWFTAVWFALAAAAYVWLVRPIGWVWGIPLLTLGLEDATIGNTAWLMALACVLGLRGFPGAWAAPLLTKITPAVGVVWFATRRDWRACGKFAIVSLLAATLSWLVSPHLWKQWVSFLLDHRTQDATLVPRVLIAIALVAFGAKQGRAWLVPVAMYIATPVVMVYGLGMLAAIPRLMSATEIARARRPFGPLLQLLRRALDLPSGHSRPVVSDSSGSHP